MQPGRHDSVGHTDAQVWLQKALAHHQAGELPQAEALYRQILQVSPNNVNALHLLGLIARETGNYAIALELIDKAIKIDPGNATACNSRGTVLQDLQQYSEALESCDRAILLKPDYADAYCNRGIALQAMQQYRQAVESFDRAIQLKPNFPEAYCNRSAALLGLMQYSQTIESCDKAILLKPDFAEAYSIRGAALAQLKQYAQALESCDRAIRLKPDFVEAHHSRAAALLGLNLHPQALESLDRVIHLKPDYAEAHCNRGNVLIHLKQYPQALESYEKALLHKPDYEYLHGLRLHAKRLLCDWEEMETQCEWLEKEIQQEKKVATPFSLLAICNSPALEKKAAEIFVRDQYPSSSTATAIPPRPKRDRIRIGYFSADFREHAVSHLMAEVFDLHDRSQFEILGFSYGPDTQDPMRLRVSAAMDRFVDIQSLSDFEAARLSRELEVDIAVDLMGFTQDYRAGIFAERAAPAQVSYLGYPGTMGADFMDYLIADHTLIPEASRQHYSEKIVYMPDSFQANDSHVPIPITSCTRADEGLPEHGYVYCCFNNNYKISADTFDIWMRILRRVEGSVLWLLEDNPVAAGKLRKEASRRGVAPQRLIFARRLPLAEHLSRQRLADLFLDTLPFNAGATASPALWAGLPVLTCMGETFAGRMAASLLRAVDLPELITTTPAEYEELAVALALSPERSRAIRETLQRNRLTTPLFDTMDFTRHLESAFIAIDARSRAGLPPKHIFVERKTSG